MAKPDSDHWRGKMICNQAYVDALTPEDREIMFANLEHLPVKGAALDSPMSWYQFKETPEVLAINKKYRQLEGEPL